MSTEYKSSQQRFCSFTQKRRRGREMKRGYNMIRVMSISKRLQL